ncbi:DUF1320 domain-containing protein [bacterium (Candidatus Blackallbacteria) CG17_big_fil_post_rev_8_21_14_2_50_48_46]|uniref:DUF1320 domain-containing protein n=1 Tax=bacterium (Candidatus Blackallbacteria) CG17_big_fil_post_rev_8_21_14_2_50_48_46 TaxID=2014261 RepID=A0A2M7G5K6_9BACT|nr:MAG: hypothetical protein COW64_24010 [bacterium (Candidatus Blackallbacteria) CG18_big_fil_WC_8_21_14_2_50_49_26]PIW17313.1 MAG: DUF1320 domain-containing protein [bacterium (Candidatus Blackallbacteria) CG17_big_fil_post_rev_8_21_14_2_50_48_46]PIW47456.1 MAG: DUF1320 domain-containing protein [bacterium (Candidatus Blackallbacteria) CG13_big_fil_rev_8_21_14_2_50_49_14]
MSYATPEDLIAASPAHLVADLTGTTEPDEVAIARALADASAEIDSYLAARYFLPLGTVPENLRRVSIDIALYRLMNLRALGDIEDARKRYEDAVKYLMAVADGKISLGLPTADSGAAAATGIAYVAAPSVMSNLGY